MKPNRIRRNHQIQKEYKRRYNEEGKRHQVICEELGKEYFLAPTYIADLVLMKLPDLPEDPQMSLFDKNEDKSN